MEGGYSPLTSDESNPLIGAVSSGKHKYKFRIRIPISLLSMQSTSRMGLHCTSMTPPGAFVDEIRNGPLWCSSHGRRLSHRPSEPATLTGGEVEGENI